MLIFITLQVIEHHIASYTTSSPTRKSCIDLETCVFLSLCSGYGQEQVMPLCSSPVWVVFLYSARSWGFWNNPQSLPFEVLSPRNPIIALNFDMLPHVMCFQIRCGMWQFGIEEFKKSWAELNVWEFCANVISRLWWMHTSTTTTMDRCPGYHTLSLEYSHVEDL